MNKKIVFGILAGVAVLIAICITQIAPIQRRIFRENTDAVERVVLEFGEKMQNVSLQSPKEIVEKDIKENYSGLVTDELLARWMADFSQAPGKIISSSWPERIKIQEIRRIKLGGKYGVSGKVIEVTSIEEIQGGAASEYNVEMIVEKQDGEWLISEFKNLDFLETVDWQTYKSDNANFSFEYPPTWEIREDYLYETPAGEKANNPTIVLCDKKVEKGNIENCIQINMRQAPFSERTKIIRENYLNLYTDDPKIVGIYEKVTDSFFVFDEVPLNEIIVDQDRKNKEIEIGYGIKYELMLDETNKNKGIVRFYGAGDSYFFRNADYTNIYLDNFFSISLIALSPEEILIKDKSGHESMPQYTYIYRNKILNFNDVIHWKLFHFFETDSFPLPYNITVYPYYFKVEEENYCCDALYDASDIERVNYRKIFYLERDSLNFLKEEKVERHLKDESAEAEKVLLEFFGYLKNKEYDKAVGLLEIPENAIQECSMDEDGFDGCPNETWNGLKTFSPQEDENSKAKVLENYASLKKEAELRANVLEIKKYSEGKYILTVQFLNSDGSILVEGPCCGNTEEGSTDKFEYKVKKIDGVFKVITAPLHIP